MVRLVFRPYTQLRRSICTSESRRTSTRVSSGFILARHSSPSFGSQRVGSRSTPQQCSRGASQPMAWPAGAPPPRVTTDLRSCRQTTLHFHCAFEIRQSQSLAHMLDSLVRVSRRAARDDAKAEPTLASRFALAVAQSFANRSHHTQDQAGRGRRSAHSTEHRHTSENGAGPTRLKGLRPAIRPDNEAPTCRCRTKGGVPPTAQQRRAPTPKRYRNARRVAINERLFVRRHASHVRLIPYWQLHGLFDSLFRVLFNFPSLYLLTIGLVVIFSFRWSLPPA